MEKRKKLKDQIVDAKHPGKKVKEDVDSWLDDNINQPLAKKGYGTLGAGISAAGSTLGDLFIPQSDAESAAAGAPGGAALGKLSKLLGLGGKKASKAKKIAEDTAEAFEPEQSLSKFSQLKQPEVPKKKPVGAKMRGERVNPEASEAYKKADEADELEKLKKRKSGIAIDYSKMK